MEQNLTQMGAGETLDVNTTFYQWAPKGSDLDAAINCYFGNESIEPLVREVGSVEALASHILDYQHSMDVPTNAEDVDMDQCSTDSYFVVEHSPMEMAELIWESLEDKVWVIDIGNSTVGQVGAVIRISAKTEAHAIELAKEWFGWDMEDDQTDEDGVATLCTYIHWDNVTTDNVSEEED